MNRLSTLTVLATVAFGDISAIEYLGVPDQLTLSKFQTENVLTGDQSEPPLDILQSGTDNATYYSTVRVDRDRDSRHYVEYSDENGYVASVEHRYINDGPESSTNFYFQIGCNPSYTPFVHAYAALNTVNWSTTGLGLCSDNMCTTGVPSIWTAGNLPDQYWGSEVVMTVGQETEVVHLGNDVFHSSSNSPSAPMNVSTNIQNIRFNYLSFMETKDLVFEDRWSIVGPNGLDDVLTTTITVKNAGENTMTCEVSHSFANSDNDILFKHVPERSSCGRIGNTVTARVNNVAISDVIEKVTYSVSALDVEPNAEWVSSITNDFGSAKITKFEETFEGELDKSGRVTVDYLFGNGSNFSVDFVASRDVKRPCEVSSTISAEFDARYTPTMSLVDVATSHCQYELVWIDTGVSKIIGPWNTLYPQCDGECVPGGEWVAEEDLSDCPANYY